MCSLTIAVHTRKVWKSFSPEGKSSGPKLVLKAWGTSAQLLIFSFCWNPETGSNIGEHISNRIDEASSKSECKQAKSYASAVAVA